MKAKMYNMKVWVINTDERFLINKLNSILLDSDFKILDFSYYKFKPFGYTAMWLLSESHLAIHTFPEENMTYIELSSCIKKQYKKFKNIFFNDKDFKLKESKKSGKKIK